MNNHIAELENNSKVLTSFSYLSLKNQNGYNLVTPMSQSNSQVHKRLSFTPSQYPNLNFFNQDDPVSNHSPIRGGHKKASIISSKSSAGSSFHHRSQLSTLLKRQFTLDQSQQSPPKAALTPKSMLSRFSKSFKEKTPIMSARSSRRELTKKDSFVLDNSFTSVLTDQSCEFPFKRQSTRNLSRIPINIEDSSPKKMSNMIRRKSCHCSDCGGLSKKERNNLNLPFSSGSRAMQTNTVAQSWLLENTDNLGFFTPTAAAQRKLKQKESRFKQIGSKALIAIKFTTLASTGRKSQEMLPEEENSEIPNFSQLGQSMTSELRKSIASSASPKKDTLDTFTSRKFQELLKPVLSNKHKVSLQDLNDGKSNQEFTASIDLDIHDIEKKNTADQSNKLRTSSQNKKRKVLRKNASIDEKMTSDNNIFDDEQKIVLPQSTNYLSLEQNNKTISRPKTSSIGPSGRKFTPRSRSKTSQLQKTISIQEIYNNKPAIPVIMKPSTTKHWKPSQDYGFNLTPKMNPQRKISSSSQTKSRNCLQATESMPNIEIKISLAPDFSQPTAILINDGENAFKQEDKVPTDRLKQKSLTCLETNSQKENNNPNPRKKSRKLKASKTEVALLGKEVVKEKIILRTSSKKGISTKTFFLGELKKIYKPRLDQTQNRFNTFKAF